jgi:hypothetical protein
MSTGTRPVTFTTSTGVATTRGAEVLGPGGLGSPEGPKAAEG